ncbi:MAG: helix-turn-helix domain-containing protein, partial [Candidatus Electrothrix sp. ATG2]|nr:helix-turn-helix domain-containing protein [Candidatus Electrothrix sp. ATG2]
MINKPSVHTAAVSMGLRLGQTRTEIGLTRVMLAAKAGVSVRSVRRMEQGDATVSIGQWLKISKALNQLDSWESILPVPEDAFTQYEREKDEQEDAEVYLYIHGVFPDGQIVEVGCLLVRNLLNPQQQEGFFRYAPSFLNHPLAYPIDPVHFPLDSKTFQSTEKTTGIHHLFDDSLPDAWGRHILARKGNMERQRFTPAHLLTVLRGSGLGRFIYTKEQTVPNLQETSIDFDEITRAVDEAGNLEEGLDVTTADLQHLLACGSSAGGARPKVLTRKNDKFWIAKLASRKDPHPNLMPSLEHAGMTLAALAGLQVPEMERVNLDNRDMFLIRRFDVTEDGGRNALVSFRTLLDQDDHYAASYSDMAAVLRSFSFRPNKDTEQLFRQMVVNVILVNSDDHLQNFAMLHTKDGWCLSPTFDIVPNIYQISQVV